MFQVQVTFTPYSYSTYFGRQLRDRELLLARLPSVPSSLRQERLLGTQFGAPHVGHAARGTISLHVMAGTLEPFSHRYPRGPSRPLADMAAMPDAGICAGTCALGVVLASLARCKTPTVAGPMRTGWARPACPASTSAYKQPKSAARAMSSEESGCCGMVCLRSANSLIARSALLT